MTDDTARIALAAVIGLSLVGAANADTLRPLKGGWQRYANDRFGTVADIPPGLKLYGEPPANSGGREFRRPDGARLLVYGSFMRLSESEENVSSEANESSTPDRYMASGKGWVVHSGRKGETIEYRKSWEGCGLTHSIVVEYPAAAKARYDAIVTRVARSLCCGPGIESDAPRR